MYQLSSELSGKLYLLSDAREKTASAGFVLGGNWDYDHGSFDKALDDKDMVWLRIPFVMTKGSLDSEQKEREGTLQFGTPFVLKHVYEDGIDSTAMVGVASSLVNQFQAPADPDDNIERKWVKIAEEELRKLEQQLS